MILKTDKLDYFGDHMKNIFFLITFLASDKVLKSVNSNFTLAVHSLKLNHAKTHFLSHFGEKKRKNMARPGFEPRSVVDHANYYSIGHLYEI